MQWRSARVFFLGLVAAGSLWLPGLAFAGPKITYAECKAGFTPPEDQATVYFFRPKQKLATGVNFGVLDESGTTVAFILNNSFMPAFLPPGKVNLTTQKSMLIKPIEFSLDLEAGKIYFVRFRIEGSGMKNVPAFDVLPEAEGESAIRDCDLYVSKEVKKDLSKLPGFLGLE